MQKINQVPFGEKSMDEKLKNKANLLVNLLNFEKYWAPYALSDGSLFKKEVKVEAANVVTLFLNVFGEKTAQMNPDGQVIKPDGLWEQRKMIAALKKWCSSDELYPEIPQDSSVVTTMTSQLQSLLVELEKMLVAELGLSVNLICSNCSSEYLFHKNVLKWAAQLPDEVVPKIDEAYIDNMSKSDTLVVVGDVRRSQDLMTYGRDPNVYRDKIIEFSNCTRRILKNNCGLYDRFTGDGFIAYFNKYMCEQEGKNYYEMMVKSCREIMDFSIPFFSEWSKMLRRLPEKEIGLAIGVDSGIVSFKDINNQLFAIGDACVWATRMNTAGSKGDVIVNNIPYQELSQVLNENNCEKICSVTKSGEQFSAYCLNIKNIHYVAPIPLRLEQQKSEAIN